MNIYTPYTYLIGWSKHNKWYYGARWAKNCHPSDLWITYFTSSKHVKNFHKEYGEPDVIEVRKSFFDAQAAKDYEEKVLRRLNVLYLDKWLNKNVNGKFLPHGKQSKEHIAKRIRWGKDNPAFGKPSPMRGKKYSDEVKEKHKGPKSKEHINNMKFHENNKPIHICPHCNMIGDIRNMKRWHFDRCKHNRDRKDDLDKNVCCQYCKYTTKKTANFYRYHDENCKSNPKMSESSG